ncbi:DUF4350 domain-containing protein [Alteromonas lipolytica]|uniref:DUF4350 domain-containing protein n=1 Tax=Alteromonas lipolytica TaxID=1856405 RepID=A0A1E8FE03_9ALTE|nr:DUF4350 domain-containing protein [Alteromonas lipolytica]OFI34152.1 hypothetical protein BFC17_21655 [Alteromonas lipolytica]GGF64954.1 hypothetical protein GCM10011338_16630 [Alteromonas lipolytica]
MLKTLFLFALLLPVRLVAEQKVDTEYNPTPFRCAYCQAADAPVVSIDNAHFNFHTLENRYAPFAKVLAADGFNVKSHSALFSEESLEKTGILVIANALNEKNETNWDLPIYSAFTRQEINVLYRWVKQGGALFLIADHMPWPAASADLAEVFGFGFFNGYVEVEGQSEQFFTQSAGSIAESPVTPLKGPNAISSVQGFLGQGFSIPNKAIPVLQFTTPAISWMPDKSWQIDDDTPFFDATHLYQGALLTVGKGKLAIFGEAGMFTAQVSEDGEDSWKMGMNATSAKQNQQLLLNIVRWLGE